MENKTDSIDGKEPQGLSDLSINHPSAWDIEQFRANWYAFLESLLEEEASSLIPSRRMRCQIEQTTVFQESRVGTL